MLWWWWPLHTLHDVAFSAELTFCFSFRVVYMYVCIYSLYHHAQLHDVLLSRRWSIYYHACRLYPNDGWVPTGKGAIHRYIHTYVPTYIHTHIPPSYSLKKQASSRPIGTSWSMPTSSAPSGPAPSFIQMTGLVLWTTPGRMTIWSVPEGSPRYVCR